jgi:enoyl-[acyl-carrier protein] reductase I
MQVSAYSLKALAVAALPLMQHGGSIVGFDFDSTSAFSSTTDGSVCAPVGVALPRTDLGAQGIRVNLIAAGPSRSLAARSIPGYEIFEDVWNERAPLGWDTRNADPIAKGCVALLSDWFPATTGEIIHVDGGFHAIGA